jgi:probable HAF family extracellular repeat protein
MQTRIFFLTLLALAASQARADSFVLTAIAGSNSANGINNAGQVVGNAGSSSFLLSGGILNTFGSGIQVNGIDDSGLISGSYTSGGHSGYGSAFLLSGDVYTTVDIPGDFYSRGGALNDSGAMAGYSYSDSGLYTGFIYSDGDFTTVADPNVSTGAGTLAEGINDSGEVVGYYSATAGGSASGFLLDDGVYTDIAVPGAVNTYAFGINDQGDIDGSYSGSDGLAHGFLLSGGVFQTIDFAGAAQTALIGINNSDQLVGYYVDGSGNYTGFEASPAPEPATFLVAGAVLIVVFGLRRKTRRTEQDA